MSGKYSTSWNDMNKLAKEENSIGSTKKEKDPSILDHVYGRGQDGVEFADMVLRPILHQDNPRPYTVVHRHTFFFGGRYVDTICPSTFGEDCPICQWIYPRWDTLPEFFRNKVKRDTKWYMNVIVYSDQWAPRRVGKVFVYKHNKTVNEIIRATFNQTDATTGQPLNVYDPYTGMNIHIVARKTKRIGKELVPEYNGTGFSSQGPIGDDNIIEQFMSQTVDLTKFRDRSQMMSTEKMADAIEYAFNAFTAGGVKLQENHQGGYAPDQGYTQQGYAPHGGYAPAPQGYTPPVQQSFAPAPQAYAPQQVQVPQGYAPAQAAPTPQAYAQAPVAQTYTPAPMPVQTAPVPQGYAPAQTAPVQAAPAPQAAPIQQSYNPAPQAAPVPQMMQNSEQVQEAPLPHSGHIAVSMADFDDGADDFLAKYGGGKR